MTESQLAVYNHKKPVVLIKKSQLDRTVETGHQLIDAVNSVITDLMDYSSECEAIASCITDLVKANSHYQRQLIDILREERNDSIQ